MAGTVTPFDEKINAMKHFPTPMNQAAIQCFLQLTVYFRKFLPKYVSILISVDEFAEKNTKFCFANMENLAFEQLRALSKKPVLRI